MLTEDDKIWLKGKCGKVDRFFLYVMVFLSMLHSCSIDSKMDAALNNIQSNTSIESEFNLM